MGSNKDRKPRTRRKMTDSERKRRHLAKEEKCKQEEAAKQKQQQLEARRRKENFSAKYFGPAIPSRSNDGGKDSAKVAETTMLEPSSDEGNDNNKNSDKEVEANDANVEEEKDPKAQSGSHCINEPVTIPYPRWHGQTNVPTSNPDIIAELDWDDEDDTIQDPGEEKETDDPNTGDTTSTGIVMREYLQSIQGRLKGELRKDCSTTKWLFSYLKSHEFWIRAEASQEICKHLGVLYKNRAYYRDVRVWLPEEQYGQIYMPSCITCESNTRVARHTCFNKCPARHVVGISRGYDIMTWQYICHSCKNRHEDTKKDCIQNGVSFVSPGPYSSLSSLIPDHSTPLYASSISWIASPRLLLLSFSRAAFSSCM